MSEELNRNGVLNAGPDDSDWTDVIRRAARERRQRSLYLLVALVGLIVVGVASAYALGHPVVDFNGAEPGSQTVINDFGSMEVGAPPGMAPGVIPEQARKIPGLFVDGKPYQLWVAPTKSGGICTNHDCIPDRSTLKGRVYVGMNENQSFTGVSQIGGAFIDPNGDRLELSYADGTTAEIPFVWVTAPIDAGFYVFDIPKEHQVAAARPTKVTLLDSKGKELARGEVADLSRHFEDLPIDRSLPGFPHLSVFPEAIWSQRRQLFDLTADDGAHIGLWVSPSKYGGTCFWGNLSGGGCSRPGNVHSQTPYFDLGANGREVTLYNTDPDPAIGVARVEARFEDGDRIELTPKEGYLKEGYLLWPIPSRHFPLGHRLEALISFDANGKQITSQNVNTKEPAVYPCKKPKDYGYHTLLCP